MTVLSIGGVVICALWVIQSLRFIELVLNSHSSMLLFGKMALFALPDLLSIVLPISIFISILYTYNKLMVEREIVVMQSVGCTRKHLSKPALLFGSIMTVLLLSINVFLSPKCMRALRTIEADLRHELPAVLLQEGVFNAFGDMMLYVQKKNHLHLQGVFAYVLDRKAQTTYVVMAKDGKLIMDEKEPKLLMLDGNRQEVNNRDGTISTLYFDKTVIALNHDPRGNKKRALKPYEIDTAILLNPPENLHKNEQNRYRIEGHQRLLSPFIVLLYILIALSFLLRAPFSRHGYARPIFKAVAGGIAVQSIYLMLVSLSGKNIIYLYVLYGMLFCALTFFYGLLIDRKVR